VKNQSNKTLLNLKPLTVYIYPHPILAYSDKVKYNRVSFYFCDFVRRNDRRFMQTGEVEFKDNNVNDNAFEELLEQSFDLQSLERGKTIKGRIVSISSDGLLVDVRSKYEGVVKPKDLDRVNPEYKDSLKVGDEIPVYVLHMEDDDGYVVLSLNKAVVEHDWDRAKQLFNADKGFEGEIISTNKGGLIVNFGSVRGFVPGSQLDVANLSNSDKANQWSNMVGKKMYVKIIEVDRRRNRLILSERIASEEKRKMKKENLLTELQEGDILTGTISSLADFGAFIDLGGVEGLIHLSELSWTQVAHPKDVVKVGEEIDVYVLNIDYQRQRIGLSLKRLQPEPWSQALDHYQPGQVVTGTITKLTNFGAFARVENVLEGLIHISELSDKQIGHPKEVIKEGQDVQLRIISIEPDKKRMGLSLKQVTDPEETWDESKKDGQDSDDEEKNKAVVEGAKTDSATASIDAMVAVEVTETAIEEPLVTTQEGSE